MSKHVGYVRVLKLILPYFFVVGFFQILGYLILGIDVLSGEEARSDADFFIVQLFGLAGTILILWLFRTKLDGESFGSLGFGRDKMWRDVLVGISAGSAIIFVGFAILLWMEELRFLSFEFSLSGFLTGMSLFVIVAINEELLMRGYVLNNFLISFNKYVALLLSSLLFALMHFSNPEFSLIGFINLFLAGVFLGLPYLFNRNLWFPIAAHFSWNFVQGTVLGFEVSGKSVSSILKHNYENASIWNGGGFGFEGSIVSSILLIMSIIILHVLYTRFSD